MSEAGRIAPQEWMQAPATRRVMAALDAAGGAPRFVGGCVRDALAGRPVSDIDIATPLAPEEVMACLRAAGIKAVPTGLAHGTVTAVAEHTPFEITTLRVDVETYGRHAKVAFTDDWVADSARRDLTINALSCEADGTLHDPFGGVEDLRAGRVRFVGDARARIEEDHLRLLRFFRFQANYGKVAPDSATLAVAASLAPKLRHLSGERIKDELIKLLRAADPVPVIEIMLARDVLQEILPVTGTTAVLRAVLRSEAAVESGAKIGGKIGAKTGGKTGAKIGGETPDPIVRLAALIEPDGAKAEEAAERLRFSNKERRALSALAEPELHLDPSLHPRVRWQALRKLGAELYRELLRLDWARRHAGDAAAPSAAFHRAVDEAEDLVTKTFPLRGGDALGLGVREGPKLGRLLEEVETWWAEDGFRASRKDCLARLKASIGTH